MGIKAESSKVKKMGERHTANMTVKLKEKKSAKGTRFKARSDRIRPETA